jgi:hypothetical protein
LNIKVGELGLLDFVEYTPKIQILEEEKQGHVGVDWGVSSYLFYTRVFSCSMQQLFCKKKQFIYLYFIMV